jgi:hypothetical protein
VACRRLANELDAQGLATRQVAERSFLGGIGGRIAAIGAAVKSVFGSERAPVGPDATKAAVTDTLDKLAQGKAHAAGSAGQGPLFELYHDALARPVLSWVQEARIKEAERRQARRAGVAFAAVL